MNLPIWPEAQPSENYLFAAVAVIIVIIERKSMLHRGTGVTAILAPTGLEQPSVRRVLVRRLWKGHMQKSNTFSAGAAISSTFSIMCDLSETEPQLLRRNLSLSEKPDSCGGLRFSKR